MGVISLNILRKDIKITFILSKVFFNIKNKIFPIT